MGKVKEGTSVALGKDSVPKSASTPKPTKDKGNVPVSKSTSTSKPTKGKADSPSNSNKSKRPENTFWTNLFSSELYKVSQGRRVRGLTFLGLAILVAAGLWRLMDELASMGSIRYIIPMALLIAGLWVSFRAIHYPRFAEFLIATDAEMNKVSWISLPDLKKTTQVVLVCVLILSLYLFGVDWLWTELLRRFGIIAG